MKKKLLFCAAILAAGAGASSAQGRAVRSPNKLPSPSNSTYPCAVRAVGRAGDVTSNNHSITIIVRDNNYNPIPNSTVVIDFAGCNGGTDPGPAGVQNGVNGEIADCATGTIFSVTDISGTVTIDAQAMASAAAVGVTPGGACGALRVDGVTFGNVQIAAFDLNGGLGGDALGLTAADLALWLNYFFACAMPPAYCAVADYNFAVGACATQELTAGDLAIWQTEFFSSESLSNDTLCP